MARMPEADWWGPVPDSNYAAGQAAPTVGLVVHHIDGSLAAAHARFMRDGSEASAHFGVGFDGQIVQWVDTDDVAYAGCRANWTGYISVELESAHSDPDAPATEAQVAAVGRIGRWGGVPAQEVQTMGGFGVGYHRQFPGPCKTHWGQTHCPGDGIVWQIPAFVAAIRGDDEMLSQDDKDLLGAWEQDTRKIILDTLGQWEQDTRKVLIDHIDKKFAELEKKLKDG